jgi:hypothetical protein
MRRIASFQLVLLVMTRLANTQLTQESPEYEGSLRIGKERIQLFPQIFGVVPSYGEDNSADNGIGKCVRQPVNSTFAE